MDYLDLLNRHGITPNFYCSSAYFYRSGLEECLFEVNGERYHGVIDEDVLMFPAFHLESSTFRAPPGVEVWSDFPGFHPGDSHIPEFLDDEFLYLANDYLNLSGNSKMVFRKNTRKWPARNPIFSIFPIGGKSGMGDRVRLAEKWAAGISSGGIEDADTMFEFVSTPTEVGVEIYKGSELVALGICDHNFKFINFRYAITQPDEPFLQEFLRLTTIQSIHNLSIVNDGGSCGRDSLKAFKLRLQPTQVRTVNTWKPKEPNS